MHLEKLYDVLGIPKALIDAYSGDTLPDNHAEILESYNKSRFDLLKASPDFKSLLETERNQTFSKTQKRVIKDLNNEFGLDLTNSQIDEIKDFKDFVATLKGHFDEVSKPKTDDTTAKELQKYKEQVSELRKANSKLTDDIEASKVDTETKIKEATDQLKAETYYAGMITRDTDLGALNIPGKSFALDAIKQKIFNDVKIDGDGKIYAKDGTSFVHPSKNKVLSTVDELFGVLKEEAGLVKRSNAGDLITGIKQGVAGVNDDVVAGILSEIREGR